MSVSRDAGRASPEAEGTIRMPGLTSTAGRAGLALAIFSLCGTAAAQSSSPDSLTLTGIVRDFKERGETGGHTDFEWRPANGFGQYAYMVADELDDDGKPVFASQGYKIRNQWKDSAGRDIMPPRPHFPTKEGDMIGSRQSATGGACHAASDFAQWFRDVSGVNVSKPLPITLVRGTNGVYTFDDKQDPHFQNLGGFFPINGDMLGNSAGEDRNFHFTFELETEFTYEQGAGQVFRFIGDDDVWVFIDDKVVIDIGGVHSAVSQTIDLDRLDWLQDGETYSLKFFFAERHRTQSNFRIETTLSLRSVDLPTVTALYD